MHSQLHRSKLSLSFALMISVTVTSVTIGGMSLFGVEADTTLGVGGLILGILGFFLAELRHRDEPTKTIVFIGQEDAIFNSNIVEGLRAGLTGAVPHVLETVSPPTTITTSLVEWQLVHLGGATASRAHAVVVLPCADDDRIWSAVLQLLRRRVIVLAIDVEPPQGFFHERDAVPPAFVASDFLQGGRAVGGLIAEHLGTNPEARGLISIGPDSSRPGSTRSSWALYEVARRGLASRCETYELTSWDSEDSVEGLCRSIIDMARDKKPVVAFCGDDRLMRDIDRRLATRHVDSLGDIALVGYDGVQDAGQRLLLAECERGWATLDTRPVAQGRAAARILSDIYDGASRKQSARQLVDVAVIRQPAPRS